MGAGEKCIGSGVGSLIARFIFFVSSAEAMDIPDREIDGLAAVILWTDKRRNALRPLFEAWLRCVPFRGCSRHWEKDDDGNPVCILDAYHPPRREPYKTPRFADWL